MKERSLLISYVRGEIVGPSVPLLPPLVVTFADDLWRDQLPWRRGAVAWRPVPDGPLQEVLYYDREAPHRKYGAGILAPEAPALPPDERAAVVTDSLGADPTDVEQVYQDAVDSEQENSGAGIQEEGAGDDFEVTSPDIRRPSTMGVSFCAHIPAGARLVVALPSQRRFPWQESGEEPIQLNGCYEPCKRQAAADGGEVRKPDTIWRRRQALPPDAAVSFTADELAVEQSAQRAVPTAGAGSMALCVRVFSRRLADTSNDYLLTVVLRNHGSHVQDPAATLYQAYFEVEVEGGNLLPYPETQRPFDQLDDDERSMLLLYRESRTWGIGHGCAASWTADPGGVPASVVADVMPAVETPSMTPDISDRDGKPIQLRMRDLASLSDSGEGSGWVGLEAILSEYGGWIRSRRDDALKLPSNLAEVAGVHLDHCEATLTRMVRGVSLLRNDSMVREAFRLANRAMLLQQIATKELKYEPLIWDKYAKCAKRKSETTSPWAIYMAGSESSRVGRWRAFQVAFLLVQLEGISDGALPDRNTVDLIWFPTGGGKTEAYLAVMAFYMFHQRLQMKPGDRLLRDGTNVLMRYTLRMLTTQQFQRAASLVCAMEYLRRQSVVAGAEPIPGGRFSVALWIGGEGSPNKPVDAKRKLRAYRDGKEAGNPLILTECPWCRTQIGRVMTPHKPLVAGVAEVGDCPQLHCPDPACEFGRESVTSWLPIEVVDSRIYDTAPSLVIATADKFAMAAYRPDAGALFGRARDGETIRQVRMPPGLIVQDELHLIAGPLGTMYGLYEGLIEALCTIDVGGDRIRPKVIASTATIRGAGDQVLALYGRVDARGRPAVAMFPPPGLLIGDSFFGVFARKNDGSLDHGRLYLGVHATNYGSILTAQVRAFSATLCRAGRLDSHARDAWWTLVTFYNSLRELGGARTLFDSDIRSRLKFLQNRENVPEDQRRRLRAVEELTSRLSQSEIVDMMNRLASVYAKEGQALDACLASSIIEVGVDIDRLSLMGVVGQPKTTAQYIQVTGRVGRRWQERPGLVLMVYNPAKSRDRSHFEQFESYHRRLYERVEPTSATPFAVSAIQRALCGALIMWARQHVQADVVQWELYFDAISQAFDVLVERCKIAQPDQADQVRSIAEMHRVRDELLRKWKSRPSKFEDFPPSPDGEYLLLWPGQYATRLQQERGVVIPTSMRQVDRSAELIITPAYTNNS